MRTKTINRSEMKEVVLNLIDLGFSTDAVSHMLKMTPTNVYAHLRSANRVVNRRVVRLKPAGVNPLASSRINLVFPESPCLSLHLLAVAQQAYPAEMMDSATLAISSGSARRGVSSARGRRKRITSV